MVGVGLEPEKRGSGAEIDAALSVGGSQEEMGRGGLGGEEVAAEGERSPADGGDEWR